MEEKKSQNAITEEKILKFWEENNIFEKSVEKKAPKGNFVFYEGPPTANGKPGIHHLESRAFKDAIPRYKTMRGYKVRRKGGWDTHGLPVELQVEKKLGLESKKAIEEYGIGKFNSECKESVWEFLEYWNKFTTRIGYWVDQKNPYVTYENNYIESLWNILGEVEKKNLLYKDYKVVPWCPRCGTGLSSHELAQGYQDVKDLSVTAKFRVRMEDTSEETHPLFNASTLTRSGVFPPTYLLAWTTTPWTLPGNVGLAVGEDIDYVIVSQNDENLILAKALISKIEGEYEIVKDKLKGKDLIGLEYEPLYPFFKDLAQKANIENIENAYKVYGADFVTTEDGTGIVHTAVMYGQDDFELGSQVGLPKMHLVDESGHFVSGTGFLENLFVRDEDTAVEVIKDLAHRGLLFKKEKYEHNYPHCWRCKTALIYYARDSWYIRMSTLREKLISENKDINWEPSHIRDGRFGEWLKDVKDWAISRERYWGTPLPVWECDDCGKRHVVNSLEDLKNKTKKSGNKYFIMRHSQAESNLKNFVSSLESANIYLTEKGKADTKEHAKYFKDKKIDLVISSNLTRAIDTARLVMDEIGGDIKHLKDGRLNDISFGVFEGKQISEYRAFFNGDELSKFDKSPEGGETLNDVRKRVGDLMYEIEKNYKNKNILIVSHGDALWMLESAAYGFDLDKTKEHWHDNYMKNTEIRELDFIPLPHNSNYELDFHRPYIDEVDLLCNCGKEMKRVKEVMDVWFDSGAMPFAQDHYPFENKDLKYPADYISEAIDQTRGWFYTLHAVGALLGKGKAYKNVICLGHILDANGKKMSKSLGNIVDPWVMMDKYGVDTLRLWMYSVNQPGDSKNFDEKTVADLKNKVFNLLYNVLSFYELYRDKEIETKEYKTSQNILDKWIIAKLEELVGLTTDSLDNYKLFEPVRAFRDFIDDLSTWYLRRSRERLKEGDKDAKATLYFVIKNLAKLMAPFAPFAAEDIWQTLKTDKDEESIHLSEWPKVHKNILANIFGNKDKKVLSEMAEVRSVVNQALKERQKNGVPVRQPLGELRIKNEELRKDYTEILKDELNVKNVVFTNEGQEKVSLNFEITPELKKEGQYREIVRAVQDMRKKEGLVPEDMINLMVSENAKNIISDFVNEMKKTTGIKNLEFKNNDGENLDLGELQIQIKISK